MGFLDGKNGLKGSKGLNVLSNTTFIDETLLLEPVWKELYSDYAQPDPTNERIVAISILNASLTHKKKWFILTRDKVEALVRADKNWHGKQVFNNKRWAHALRFMYDEDILKLHEKIGQVTVYELILASFQSYFPNDLIQKQEVLDFANKSLCKSTYKKTVKSEQSSATQTELDDHRPPLKEGQRYYTPDPAEIAEINRRYKFSGTDEDLL